MKQILGWILAAWLNLVIAEIIRRIVRARRRTARTTGRVVRVAMREAWRSPPSLDVEFLDSAGVRRELSLSAGTSWNQSSGRSQVEVSYDPSDPSNAALSPTEQWEEALIWFIVLGAVVAVVGTLVLINVFDRVP